MPHDDGHFMQEAREPIARQSDAAFEADWEARHHDAVFYVRCAGDGSWLVTPGEGQRGAIFKMRPTNPMRVTEAQAIALGFPPGEPVYEHIPCAKSVSQHVLDYLKANGPRHFNRIYAHLGTRVPFALQAFEMSGVLNTMLRKGEVEIDIDGLSFIVGTQNAGLDIINPERDPELQSAIDEAKAALVGDSNDAEHDALVSFVRAMGLEIPECIANCEDKFFENHGKHADDCPQRAWQKEGN